MTIILRPSLELSDDDDLVIHMGAGARRDVVRAAIRNYHAYEGIEGGTGAFTVSVFAAIGGVTEPEIVEALPQRCTGWPAMATCGIASLSGRPRSPGPPSPIE